MADNKMSPEGTELQENIDTPERADGKSTETEEVKSKTREKLEKLMMTAGVIAILVAPGAGAAAKEKLNNWGDLKDKISDLESGEQIQLKMTQEKLDELKPKIQEMGVTIKKKENNVVVIENPSFDDMFGGMEEDAEEEVEESEKELAKSEESLKEQRQETEEQRQETEEQRQETEEQVKKTAEVIEKEMEMLLATVDQKDVKLKIVHNFQNLLEKTKEEEQITKKDLNEINVLIDTLHQKNGEFQQNNQEGLDIIIDYIKSYMNIKSYPKSMKNKVKEIESKLQKNQTGIG